MSQFVETPTKTFTAGGAIAQHLRVKLSAGKLAAAGASDVEIGTMEQAAFADGNICAVRLRSAQGTRKMVASEAITAGNPVYAAASGKIAASGTVYNGTALESSTANNDVIEILPGPNTDVTATITGTNAAAFEVDADAATPKLAIAGQAAGAGDFTTTLKPETTLSADNAIIVPEADGDTLVAVALAQTLTNKTLTAPVIQVIAMTGTTGNQEIRLTTNLADALSIEDSVPGDLIVFDTTTGAQAIEVTPVVKSAGGILLTGGAATAAVVARFGDTLTEGLEVRVIDEVVTLTNAVENNLTQTVPSGAVILSAQVNLQTLVVGDGSGDNGLTKVGLGTTADPDKYGLTGDLLKNTKSDKIPDWAVLSGAETVCVKAADNAGAAVTEKFVGGETVRVRIVYLMTNSLDDAA